MKRMLMVGFVMGIGVICSMGAYTGWRYNTADLNGAESVQARVDDLDDRLDALGVTSATALDITPNKVTIGTYGVLTAQTASVTNGQAVTPTTEFLVLTGIGGAADSTNTVTVADPGVVGRRLMVAVSSVSTCLVSVADSGNCQLSGAWLGGSNDVIQLIASATNKWIQSAVESDN